jgi:hypothetical protein
MLTPLPLANLRQRSCAVREAKRNLTIVRVGNEQILLSFRQELVEHTRVQKSIVQVTVTRGVPVLLVVISSFRAREQGLLVNSGISRLVEGRDAKLLVGILFDDAEGVFVGIEGGHENQGNIDPTSGVEVLNLADSEVQEGHVILDLQGALGTGHACLNVSI